MTPNKPERVWHVQVFQRCENDSCEFALTFSSDRIAPLVVPCANAGAAAVETRLLCRTNNASPAPHRLPLLEDGRTGARIWNGGDVSLFVRYGRVGHCGWRDCIVVLALDSVSAC